MVRHHSARVGQGGLKGRRVKTELGEIVAYYTIYVLVPLLVVLILICFMDIRYRTIGNHWVIACAILVVLINIIEGREIHFLPAFLLLSIGFILFNFNVIGGGDVKLMAVLALAFEPSNVMLFIYSTAFFGGVIALLALCFFWKKSMTQGIAYGVAIIAGFIITYYSQFIFQLDSLG